VGIVTGVDNLGEDLVLLSLNPASGRVMTAQKIAYGLMGSELVRLVAANRIGISGGPLFPIPSRRLRALWAAKFFRRAVGPRSATEL